MATVIETHAEPTIAQLLERLGDIAPGRVLLHPAPGSASEADLLRVNAGRRTLFELVDGTLVEKAMGYRESLLAMWIVRLLGAYLDQHDIGELSGPDGMMRLGVGLVRIPDVAFIRRERFAGLVSREAIAGLAPDLAIEVLSPSNTASEMERKLGEYFGAGVVQVWLVEAELRRITIYTGVDASVVLREGEVIDGGEVLPGLNLAVERVFERWPFAG